jgi:hypothetical protein
MRAARARWESYAALLAHRGRVKRRRGHFILYRTAARARQEAWLVAGRHRARSLLAHAHHVGDDLLDLEIGQVWICHTIWLV